MASSVVPLDTSTNDENQGQVSEALVEDSSSAPKLWSKVLCSDPNLSSFSPAVNLGSDGLHGIGLELATERTKSVGKFGRRTIAYLTDIATTYDNFGKILVKASQTIHPNVWKISESENGEDSSAAIDPTLKSETTVQSCYDSVRDFGVLSTRLAEYYRLQIVAPLKTRLSANRTAIEAHGQRYVAARAQCFETRKRAVAARALYVKAVYAAEKSFRSWKRARKAESSNGDKGVPTETSSLPSESPLWEQTLRKYGSRIQSQTDELVKKLHHVETTRLRYQELVENENDAVSYAQKMEAVTLDALQEVEISRVTFFLGSVVQALCSANPEALEKLPMTSTSFEERQTNEEATSLDLKKGKDLLANIFLRQAISYEEGMGRTDAETLGLPLAMGILRDDVKKMVASIGACIKAAEILMGFLDTFGGAVSDLGTGLKIDSIPTNTRQQPLAKLASDTIGPAAAEMWKGVVKIYEDEAEIANELASSSAKLRLQKLELFLETAQKDLKAEKEYDDANWKTLCDVGRTETKAAARYRQVRAQQEKARERILSVDSGKCDDSVEEQSTPTKNRMSKALFAGGEAMKKFQENARLAMAKSNLNDAEQNAAKEQQALDEATATKSQAVADYKRVTEARIQKLETIDKSVRKDLEKVMEAVMDGIERLRKARKDGLAGPLEGGKGTGDRLLSDVDEWMNSAKDRIEANRKIAEVVESEARGDKFGEGFQLSISLVSSDDVSNLLSLDDPHSVPPDFISNTDGMRSTESSEDELDIAAVESFESNGSKSIGKSVSIDIPAQGGIRANGSGTKSTPVTPTKSSGDGRVSISTTPTKISVDDDEHEGGKLEHADSNFEGTEYIKDKKQKSHDMNVFMRQFWKEHGDSSEAPSITKVLKCAYRPKEKAGFLIPALHGTLYTSADKLYFLALDGKSFVLSCADIASVAKEKGFMGAGDHALAVTYKTPDGESAFVLSRLVSRDTVLEHLHSLSQQSHARNAPELEAEEPQGEALPPVPEDETLKKMTIVLSKPIRGVTIKQVYEKAWSEGNRSTEKPFYGPWLEEEECFDIFVGDWEFPEPGSEPFIGPWDKEHYTMRRKSTFRFKRTTHLYIGPPVAFVNQTHYCRVEGNDKCVVCISASMEGIPYSDTFVVEMRWVARRQGSNDIDVKVGLEVDFKKSSMLKSQIRSGTITETTNVYKRMFEAIKKACNAGGAGTSDGAVVEEESETAEEEVDVELAEPISFLSRLRSNFSVVPINPNFLLFASATLAYPLLWNFFSALLGAPALSMNEAHRLNVQIQELRDEVRELKASLNLAVELLKQRD